MGDVTLPGMPPAQGLYNPENERDACGVGFVVNLKGKKSHDIVTKALQVLVNLLHRGACGCEANTGDGAGILIQIPHTYLKREMAKLGLTLPAPGQYGTGCVFLPQDKAEREQAQQMLEKAILTAGQKVLGWRDVPTSNEKLGQ